MSTERSIILHVGAPKCGSSALQAALSEAPRLTTKAGETLAYTGLRARSDDWSLLSGRMLRSAARRSVHGYVSWPSTTAENETALFSALDHVRRKAGRAVPVVSNEGWIGQADAFAEALPHWFTQDAGAPVEICAFVRPPIDWLNAAYWQWGVWSGRPFQAWVERTEMPYSLGAMLTRWAALPNTRLRLGFSGDVLAEFEETEGVALPRPAQRNVSLPPAMLGFLMRNRRYRSNAHDNAAEFIFQRWCKMEDGPRLWAVLPRHLIQLREALRADLDLLFALVPEDRARAIRAADPRWTSEEPYHERILQGRSRLDDPEELAQLYRVLVSGVGAAAAAAGKAVPKLPPVLSTRASVHAWDVAVAQALEHLIAFDTDLRRRRLPFV